MRRALLLPAPLLLCAAALAQDVLVIAPDDLARSLPAWRRHREAQGHVVAVRPPAEDLPALVRRVHGESGGRLRFVLLLGDAKAVPPTYAPAETIRIWEKETRIATDHHLSDVDGDELPDVAVGRIPADTPEEAEAMLLRAVAYETGLAPGVWQRRVNVIAGVPGFNRVYDFLIESASTTLLKEYVPAAYDLHVTWANPASPFCPPPARVVDAVLERLNEGALIVAYMGHGSPRGLDRVRFGPRRYPIFEEDHVDRLDARHPPILFLCCCSTGQFDGGLDCLAEFALKAQGGPIAVIAASRVSMPYANGVLSKEMLEALFRARVATVGEMVQLAKRRLVQAEPSDRKRVEIDALARWWRPKPEDLAAERREHLFLYNLLGDPALRIPRPGELALRCARRAAPGSRLEVTGSCALAGDVVIELVAERTPRVPPREGDTPEAFTASYARANAWVRAETRTRCDGKGFAAALDVPAGLAPGRYFVRAYASASDGFAIGERALEIAAPPRDQR